MKWAALALALVAAGCSDASNTQYLPIGSRCSSSSQCGTSPYSCAIAGYPYGYGLKIQSWFLEQWLAKANELYANNDNGRKARATKVLFDNAVGKS
ncbi:MAG: hypothetical protein ACXVAN_16720, partial [Polyangia bacterium]